MNRGTKHTNIKTGKHFNEGIETAQLKYREAKNNLAMGYICAYILCSYIYMHLKKSIEPGSAQQELRPRYTDPIARPS